MSIASIVRSRVLRAVPGLLILASMGGAAGCGAHYAVRDPATGTTYYTTNVNRKPGGGVTLRDARTGSKVTLQNSEIKKVSKDEYNRALE